MENGVIFCFAILTMLQMPVAEYMTLCDGLDGQSCCQGYKLDQDKCIACEIGFYGKNCEHKCPYPTYGRDCQSQCNCSVAKCDHVNGCEHSLVGTPNVSEDSTTTSGNPESDAKNTLNKRINYSIFGLTALSLILCMVYLYTRSLEKRLVKTSIV